VGLTTPHHKKLLLRNLKGGGQGPTWAAGPLDGWMFIVKSPNTCAARDGQLRSHDAWTLKGQGSNSRGLPCTVDGSRSTPRDKLQLVASDCMEKAVTDVTGG
jgi:hypothetical protein